MWKVLKVMAVILVLGIAGCPAKPQYEYRMVQLSAHPEMSRKQAESDCRAEVQMAASVIADNQAAFGGERHSDDFDTLYANCLAKHGWRQERSCQQNCSCQR